MRRGRMVGGVLAVACGVGLMALVVETRAQGWTRGMCAPGGVAFTPQAGFGGASQGRGALRFLVGEVRTVEVDSHGRVQADGSFRLDQALRIGDAPLRRRHWVIRTVAPGRYAATLSDADGDVAGHHAGARLDLRYRAKGPVVMHQVLVLCADGRIDNRGRLTVLGVPVGWLRETIMRGVGAGAAAF